MIEQGRLLSLPISNNLVYICATNCKWMQLTRILELIRKDFILEIRNAQTISAIILFTFTVSFIVYKSFNVLQAQSWNVMLWIVTLFSLLNSLVKSFNGDAAKTGIFYYSLYHPTEVILAKIVYNYFLSLFVFSLIYLAFSFLLENHVRDHALFTSGALLGILGISVTFSFVSAIIASQENGMVLLMAVLALPLTLPCMLVMIKISSVALGLMVDSSVDQDLMILGGIDLLLLSMVFLLFNQLWKA